MKSTGIVRKVDELGRIVLPMELRKTLNINIKDPIEIFVEEEKIILRKFENSQACLVTGEILENNISLADGKIILSRQAMEDLIEELKNYIEVNI